MKKTIVVAALVAAGIPTTALGAAARSTSGTIYAGVTHQEGKDLYISGDFKDKLLGRGAITYITSVSANAEGEFLVKARKITIFTPKGSLSGKGSATQVMSGDQVTVKDGKFKLDRGTQKMKGMSISGTFTGVQTDGVYKFDYVGKLRR
jgi:hypothetical protein